MKHILFTIFSIAIITLSSCTQEAANNSNKRMDYEYLGEAFCKCAQPTIELNQELQMLKRTDKQAFIAKLKEAGTKAKMSINCCQETMKNHTSTAPNPNDLKKALKRKCDGIPTQMLDEIVGIISEQ